MKKNRAGILAGISDWLRLLGLIVLVAEAVMLATIAIAPESNPLVPLYPVFMLLFLLVPVVGLFWDQDMKRKSRQRFVEHQISQEDGEKLLIVDTSAKSITAEEAEKLDTGTEIIEKELGFTFHSPKLDYSWSKPRILTQHELLRKKGVEMSLEELTKLERRTRAHPLGDMFLEAKNFILTTGDPIEIHLTDTTSTRLIDGMIEVMISELEERGEEVDEEKITAKRKDIVHGWLSSDRFTMWNAFIVSVFDKALAKSSPVEPNLGNVFLTLICSGGEDIGNVEILDAGKDSVLCSISSTLSNVLIRNQLQEITVHRVYRLTKSKSKFFLVRIEYSPQTYPSPNVWQDLMEMLDSFNMIRGDVEDMSPRKE